MFTLITTVAVSINLGFVFGAAAAGGKAYPRIKPKWFLNLINWSCLSLFILSLILVFLGV